jgi:glycosyltransferase involved in cell wall biosynthesis
MKISIIVPAHNEEENIVELVERAEQSLKVDHELVVVNDHSQDKTCDLVNGLLARYPALRLVHNVKPAGFANAIVTGLKNAKGGAVVPMMGDLSDDPGTVNLMAAKIEQGYDVVCGSRYMEGGRRIGGSKLKGLLSFLAGWSLRCILGLDTRDVTNPFKMYRKEVIDSLKIESRSFEISIELVLKAARAGFRITEVPTVFKERTRGKSSFSVLKLVPAYLRFYLWSITQRKRAG